MTASYGVRSVKHLLATTLTGTLVAAAGTATALFLKRTLVSHSILLDGNLPRELLGGLVRIFHPSMRSSFHSPLAQDGPERSRMGHYLLCKHKSAVTLIIKLITNKTIPTAKSAK